jgi:hypothetical protein
MFEKIILKRKIKKCRNEILFIEQKRSRSQAALVEAILTRSTPSDEDVDYFNRYTAEIEEVRERMHHLKVEFEKI